ncbi:TetR/AcrR family transcriptional regulator [Sinimarinibacterium sp. NLF-5-8]|uniref:TetR/AcrR family transcriptional regulator n=1 Tax=Sinimarinibacterium sp. NLF-5-8 TaxID=2698684 RepID=UPI00137C2082|nr:TetR/AcrR family transcriptional regulator [Sinimarinibacterium sp. NLF-5-8]QHS09190.1 TetR/AcrR family transcriptional regulator [Sinimarinibacterium sp. NLF-5-8]
MGTKERKQRQFEKRERQFLDAARELIASDGLLSLQVSKVADRCEYAVGTLYQHFSSKEDLLLTLTTVQTQDHLELFQQVAQWQAPTRDRMFAIAVADMVFVHRYPDHFRIAQYALCEVVWKAASDVRRQEFLEASNEVAMLVRQIVCDAVAAGDLQLNRMTADEVCAGLWSLTYGTHNLVHADGVLGMFSADDAYRLMCRHVQLMLNGLGWLPLRDPADHAATEHLIEKIQYEVFHDPT